MNVCWVRTATRAAPCNKSAMTDNPYLFPKISAKPVRAEIRYRLLLPSNRK